MKTKIKTLILVFVITSFTFTACKKKDDEQNTGKDHLNPPSWIQFTWTKPNGLNGTDGYRFSNDDMFTVMYDQGGNLTVDLSYLESIQNKDYTINEQSTSSSYQFSVHYNATNSTESWQFNLLQDGQLQYTDNAQGVFTYTKLE